MSDRNAKQKIQILFFFLLWKYFHIRVRIKLLLSVSFFFVRGEEFSQKSQEAKCEHLSFFAVFWTVWSEN